MKMNANPPEIEATQQIDCCRNIRNRIHFYFGLCVLIRIFPCDVYMLHGRLWYVCVSSRVHCSSNRISHSLKSVNHRNEQINVTSNSENFRKIKIFRFLIFKTHVNNG